ncbi:hypothetical protein V1511DRAFT_219116 [Dipodascopsis uninucleata]
MSVRDIASFPIQKHSYCTVPIASPSSAVSWAHSPYRDSLLIAFDPTTSESVRIRVMWKAEVLEDVDLSETRKLMVTQPTFVVIVRSPCIGVKYMYRTPNGSMMIRRFQLRFGSDELFSACLQQFQRYNCLIKGASGSISMSQAPSISNRAESPGTPVQPFQQQDSEKPHQGSSQFQGKVNYSNTLPANITSSSNMTYTTEQYNSHQQQEAILQNQYQAQESPLQRISNLQTAGSTVSQLSMHATSQSAASSSRNSNGYVQAMGSVNPLGSGSAKSLAMQPPHLSTGSQLPFSNSSISTKLASALSLSDSRLSTASSLSCDGLSRINMMSRADDTSSPNTAPSLHTPSRSAIASSPALNLSASQRYQQTAISARPASTIDGTRPLQRSNIDTLFDRVSNHILTPVSLSSQQPSSDTSRHSAEDTTDLTIDDCNIENMIIECLKDPNFMKLVSQVDRVLKSFESEL